MKNFENGDQDTVLTQLVKAYVQDQKRSRRARFIYRFLILIILGLVVVGMFNSDHLERALRMNPHVGLIDIRGAISDNQGTNAENFIKGLAHAYENENMKALIFRIDSPGGSPVQADDMYNAIRYYRQKYPDVKTYAVCVDVCASAAYYVAVAADEIYANPASMVGSIGVIYNGFGFVDTMQKLGVSRRLQTAGTNKAFMDQFSPIKPEDQANLQVMLDIIHRQFIERVKAGRGPRLMIDDQTFSGLFWTGSQAKTRGLIDGFASSQEVARDKINIDSVVDYTEKESVIDQMAKNIGSELASQLPKSLGIKPGFQ